MRLGRGAVYITISRRSSGRPFSRGYLHVIPPTRGSGQQVFELSLVSWAWVGSDGMVKSFFEFSWVGTGHPDPRGLTRPVDSPVFLFFGASLFGVVVAAVAVRFVPQQQSTHQTNKRTTYQPASQSANYDSNLTTEPTNQPEQPQPTESPPGYATFHGGHFAEYDVSVPLSPLRVRASSIPGTGAKATCKISQQTNH